MTLRKTGFERFRREIGGAVDRGVDRGANLIADVERQIVPVDTGALRDSIRVEGAAGSRRRQVIAGGGNVTYAAHVNYGTQYSPAQPFVEPAVQAIDVQAEIKREIEALAR